MEKREIKALEKEIDNQIAKRNNLLALLIVFGGGSIGLLLNLNGTIKIILFFAGVLCFCDFLIGILNTEDKIKVLKGAK